MNYINHTYILLIIALFIFSAFSADEETQKISIAIKNGDAHNLSNYFSKNIRLKMDKTDRIYSSKQAEAIIDDFFSGNKPTEYKITSVRSNGYSKIIIGEMVTKNKKFRIYYQLARNSGNQEINFIDIQLMD